MDDAIKHLDETIRWRERAFHWPRIILSFVIIYGVIALGIYTTYQAYRYLTAASVDSRQSFRSQSAIYRISWSPGTSLRKDHRPFFLVQ